MMKTLNDYFTMNYYGGTYAVVAEAEDGKFTESEENDIIKFLSTFRQEYE